MLLRPYTGIEMQIKRRTELFGFAAAHILGPERTANVVIKASSR